MVHLLLDNGAGCIKYGISGVDKTSRSASNCLAKINKQMQVLVADQIDNTQNGSALHYIRPFERGYLTNMSAQIEVWDRVFNKLLSTYPGQSNNNSSSSQKNTPRLDPRETSLVLTEPPFAPVPLQNDLNEGKSYHENLLSLLWMMVIVRLTLPPMPFSHHVRHLYLCFPVL